ncbi:hypothetical protein GF412_00485 [Candidatus Micrarchaeota archaeon]|nr:hypothetical protein [Candidatus Micrarchaeota archaeon]MBD3417452.1 hypothetical protein [Candidatus Micrarchaeota archaeon]
MAAKKPKSSSKKETRRKKKPEKKKAGKAAKGKKAKKTPSAKWTKSSEKRKRRMEKVVENVVSADKKLVEWRKSLMEPAERGMIEFFLYPVAKNRGEKEAAKKVIVESYIRGDEVVKQFILFLAHEQLSRAAGVKTMHNFSHYRKMMGKESKAGEVRKAVYRTVFNYTTSLEGLSELLLFLGELGDDAAAKLITYHLSYYTSLETPALQMLRNSAIESLSECSSPYALEALLNYAKYSEKGERALYALKKWDEKLGETEISEEEKRKYRMEIAEMFTGGKEKHEYYR